MIQIFAIDEKTKERLEITNNLYWFEEQGVRDFGGEAHWGTYYTFEIYVRGVMVYPPGVCK